MCVPERHRQWREYLEIAPEIALANGIAFDGTSRIQFRHLEDAASRIAM
jgi:hypothetical protein